MGNPLHCSNEQRDGYSWREAHLPLALPINKEAIFVDLEQTIQLDFRVVLFFGPAIENATVTERFRHLDLPVELELLRHLCDVPPTSGKLSPDTAFPRFCQQESVSRWKRRSSPQMPSLRSIASNVSKRCLLPIKGAEDRQLCLV